MSPYDRLVARHKELSVISSADDDPGLPNDRLIDIVINAVAAARVLPMTIMNERGSARTRWDLVWPGEHYRLLAGLVSTLQPVNVVEVGTFTGMGTLSLLAARPSPSGSITTFDIVPWRDFSETWLRDDDFSADSNLRQILANVADSSELEKHREIFESADFIFLDGPKDGLTEPAILAGLGKLQTKPGLLVMLDDIRVMNMIDVWRGINRPKLDATSFGHWSGTGLVDWNGTLPPRQLALSPTALATDRRSPLRNVARSFRNRARALLHK